MKKNLLISMLVTGCLFIQCSQKYNQPTIVAHKTPVLTSGQYKFKDLNKNGKLDKYEDWRLPRETRIENLISLMTLEEKAGLMFHPNIAVPGNGIVKYDLSDEEKKELADATDKPYAGPIGPGGQQPAGAPPASGDNQKNGKGARPAVPAGFANGQMKSTATAKAYIEEKNFRNILNNGIAEPVLFAKWSNGMQEIAEGTRLGIPIMFSTDPRHGTTLGAHVSGRQYFSQWPSKEGQYGIAASRDNELVEKYGEVVAKEYRAVGLHMILGPQIDVTTEPRWGRNAGAFSESAELTADQLVAFMKGA
jgi:beta-glucosidase